MSKDGCIYGVDLSCKVTPIQVRDAIIECFSKAQEDLMKNMRETTELSPEYIKEIHVDDIINNAFEEVGANFNKPTKEDLVEVLIKLKEYTKNIFRDYEVINKHVGEIKQLIDKLE
jgi:hypothetical protein